MDRLKKIIVQNRARTPLGIMAHMVLGYPSEQENIALAQSLEKSGAEILELQIPFTDPLADGATILWANQLALEKGMNVNRSLLLTEKIAKAVSIPVVIMTYYNIVFRMGVDVFGKDSKEAGASAVIVPDIPFDEKYEDFYSKMEKTGQSVIPVFSPTMEDERLKLALQATSSEGDMIYCTLLTGITGEKKTIASSGFDFLEKVKSQSKLPIGAGFGLSSSEQLLQLKGKADIAVVGSHLINLHRSGGVEKVSAFLTTCVKTIGSI